MREPKVLSIVSFMIFFLLFVCSFDFLATLEASYSYTHPHWPPACSSPSTPGSPVHRCVLVHFGGFEILLRELVGGARLLVSLILLRAADVSLVVGGIWIIRRTFSQISGSSLSCLAEAVGAFAAA